MTHDKRPNLGFNPDSPAKPITYRQLRDTLAGLSENELDQAIRIIPKVGRELVGLYTLATENEQIDITEQISGQSARRLFIVAAQAVQS